MARGVSARVSSRTGQHRCCCVAMELSDAADEMSSKEMDVDSADEMSSKEMDIDSDLSLASPPPKAHDGSDCSSGLDWSDTEPRGRDDQGHVFVSFVRGGGTRRV